MDDDIKFKRNDKTNLSDYNLDELRGWMIEQMIHIENKIDWIIVRYFKPENESEFNQIILNSSIISMGGKLKILRNIESFDVKIIGKIREISSIRNGFAHAPTVEARIVRVDLEKGKLETTPFNQIVVMKSDGRIKFENADKQVILFIKLYNSIMEYVDCYTH